MALQETLFDTDALNPEIAKVADRYVALMDDKESIKKKLEVQTKNLMGMMKRIHKLKIRHQGHTIEIVHKDEVDNLKLKKQKGTESKKAKRKGSAQSL